MELRIRPRLPTKANRMARHAIKPDRKSTRLNSSHQIISYAVFCLKKKNKRHNQSPHTILSDDFSYHKVAVAIADLWGGCCSVLRYKWKQRQSRAHALHGPATHSAR